MQKYRTMVKTLMADRQRTTTISRKCRKIIAARTALVRVHVRSFEKHPLIAGSMNPKKEDAMAIPKRNRSVSTPLQHPYVCMNV
jgi:hypothetical protein